MKLINTILVALLAGVTNAFADITVSDVKVFSSAVRNVAKDLGFVEGGNCL